MSNNNKETRRSRNLLRWRLAHRIHQTASIPPYKSHTFEKALAGYVTRKNTIQRHVFLSAVMAEFKFKRALGMEGVLDSFYSTFDGSGTGTGGVDYRLVLCTFNNITMFKSIPHNSRHLFFMHYNIFTEGFTDHVSRLDLLEVISLCACTTGDFEDTKVRLDETLTNLSGIHNLKPKFRTATRDIVMEALELNPGIMLSFKEQSWERLSDEQRFEILSAKEEVNSRGFEYEDFKFKLHKAISHHRLHTLAWLCKVWVAFKEESLRIKDQRGHMLRLACKRRLRRWHRKTQSNLARRVRVQIARATGDIIVKGRRFQRWRRTVAMYRTMRLALERNDEHIKNYASGLGKLRHAWYRMACRKLVRRWDDEAKEMARWDYAARFHRDNVKKRNWLAFKFYIKGRIIVKNRELDALDRQAWLGNLMKDADEEVEAMISEDARFRATEIVQAEEEQALEKERRKRMLAQRKKAQAGANDRLILEIQSEDRRRRVEAEVERLQEEWEDEWSSENKQKNTYYKEKTIYKKRNGRDSADTCYRCGRDGHRYKQCWEREHVNGVHVVKKGDTIDSISVMYDVNVVLIRMWNNVGLGDGDDGDGDDGIEARAQAFAVNVKVGDSVIIRNVSDTNWHAQMQHKPALNWTEDMLLASRSTLSTWLNDAKSLSTKETILKRHNELKREFYAPPTIGNAIRERMLTSEANVALATLDGKMFERGVIPAELLYHLDSSGDGTVSHAELREGIEALDIDFPPAFVRSIIWELDPSNKGRVSTEDFRKAMECTYEYNGRKGSPWKMHVNQAQQVLMYKNVLTNEEVQEHDMTSTKLTEIARATFVCESEFRERNRIVLLKRADLVNRVRHRAARSLQKMYWIWKARSILNLQKWRNAQALLQNTKKAEKKAANLFVKLYRRRLVFKRCWFRVQITWEKKILLDPIYGLTCYYYNHVTNETSYTKPYALLNLFHPRRRGDQFKYLYDDKGAIDLELPLPWAQEYDEEGRVRWTNYSTEEKHEMPDVFTPALKPLGYAMCGNCDIELAIRRCMHYECDGFVYCYSCYRSAHMYEGADHHTFERVEPIKCELCVKNAAGKNAGGRHYCYGCFERIGKGGVFRGKVVYDV